MSTTTRHRVAGLTAAAALGLSGLGLAPALAQGTDANHPASATIARQGGDDASGEVTTPTGSPSATPSESPSETSDGPSGTSSEQPSDSSSETPGDTSESPSEQPGGVASELASQTPDQTPSEQPGEAPSDEPSSEQTPWDLPLQQTHQVVTTETRTVSVEHEQVAGYGTRPQVLPHTGDGQEAPWRTVVALTALGLGLVGVLAGRARHL